MARSYIRARRGLALLPVGRRTPLCRHRPYAAPIHQHETSGSEKIQQEKVKEDSEGTKFGRSVLEGSTIALLSLLGLGLGGYAYNYGYKKMVLEKIENAFSKGYSSNELVALGNIAYGTHPDQIAEVLQKDYWVPHADQQRIDDIINGKVRGRYYLLTGERGTGKRCLLVNSMRKVAGDGIAMLEAHNDLEVFRVRLGKAIDFEFHEDYIGSLFSIKGPRDSTPLLDIERALNKMEKVALTMRKARGKPLTLIINNIHLVKDDVNGQGLLEMLQQRAEIWARNELVTTIFTSDEHWVCERMTPLGTNMQTLVIRDVPKETVMSALKKYRARFYDEDVPSRILEEVYAKVGGRLILLDQVAKSEDMISACRYINRKEKAWFLAQCWIYGENIDEEAEDQQSFSAAAMILARELVQRERGDGQLPEIPLHEARQIIARGDHVQGFDHINVIHTDSGTSMVRADSVAMQNAFREICTAPCFAEHLKATLARLEVLDILGRTREISFKDPQSIIAANYRR